jgi:hypothetical protein
MHPKGSELWNRSTWMDSSPQTGAGETARGWKLGCRRERKDLRHLSSTRADFTEQVRDARKEQGRSKEERKAGSFSS